MDEEENMKRTTHNSTSRADDDQSRVIPLPPSDKKTTVFLDMDNTLVHSALVSRDSPPGNYDFIVQPVNIQGVVVKRYVLKRPFVDEFLEFLSKNDFEIVVFTTAMQEYASLVLDRLDTKGLISHRLYRDSCKKSVDGKGLVKDLSGLGRDLKKAVIVDDNPVSYSLQPENGIPISPFVDDIGDCELKKLMSGFFEKCHEFEDMRDAVKHYLTEVGRPRPAAKSKPTQDSKPQKLIQHVTTYRRRSWS